MYDPTDEELIQRILPVLEIDHQYVRHVEAWDQDLISQVRRCGRVAARRLGYGVRTFQSDPDKRDDGRVVVVVAVTRSTPDEEKRIRVRGDLLMREAWNHLADAAGHPWLRHSQPGPPRPRNLPDSSGRFRRYQRVKGSADRRASLT